MNTPPFRAVLNDMYSKDASKKIRSVLKNKKEQGLFLGKVAPYGYRKSAENKYRLVVDPIAAAVIKEIFEQFLQGKGCYIISSMLSERKVPIPSQHNNITVGNARMSYGLWSHTTIRRILRNEVYTGTLIQSKYKKLNYKSRKTIETNIDDRIITKNAHEAIIDKGTFEKAQRLLEATARLRPSKHRYLLSGLIRCYDCGSHISLTSKDKKYSQIYGRCGRYVRFHKFGLCATHSFNYTKLEAHVLALLKGLCQKYLDIEHVNSALLGLKSDKNNLEAKIKLLENEIVKIERRLEMLYDDRLNGIITLDNFKKLSSKANADCDSLKEQLSGMQSSPKIRQSKKEQDDIIKEFLSLDTPTQALMTQLIERIEVKEKHEFDIYFAFPELQALLGEGRNAIGNIER